MNTHQITALDNIENALSTLRSRMKRRTALETRRDELKEFLNLTLTSVQQLVRDEHEHCDASYPQIAPVLDDMDAAFMDAIDFEELQEPRIDPRREWGTYHTHNGRVA